MTPGSAKASCRSETRASTGEESNRSTTQEFAENEHRSPSLSHRSRANRRCSSGMNERLTAGETTLILSPGFSFAGIIAGPS